MRRISFYKNNRSDDLLHIETEGCVINIRVGLHNNESQEVTSVEIIPDRNAEIGEGKWELNGTNNNRVIKIG